MFEIFEYFYFEWGVGVLILVFSESESELLKGLISKKSDRSKK